MELTLTEEQKRDAIKHRDLWLSYLYDGQFYREWNDTNCEKSMKQLYKFCNYDEPDVIVTPSPYASKCAYNLLLQINGLTINNVKSFITSNETESYNYLTDIVYNNMVEQITKNQDKYVKIAFDCFNQDLKTKIKHVIIGNLTENEDARYTEMQYSSEVVETINNRANDILSNINIDFSDFKLEYVSFSTYINYGDFGWLSLYTFDPIHQLLDEKLKGDFNQILNFVKNSFLSIQLADTCITCKYPKFTFKEGESISNLNGPSLVFDDEYEIYFINGLHVNKELYNSLLNRTYTFEMFAREENEEIKAAVLYYMQEKFGESAVVDFLSSTLTEVDSYVDTKPEQYLEGTTKSTTIGVYKLSKGKVGNNEVAYVRCYCPSTDRMFYLGVEPHHTNVKDAIASLYNVPKKVVNHIDYIQRQGEIFSTVLTKEGKEIIKTLSKEEIQDTTTISGDEYFAKMRYEY